MIILSAHRIDHMLRRYGQEASLIITQQEVADKPWQRQAASKTKPPIKARVLVKQATHITKQRAAFEDIHYLHQEALLAVSGVTEISLIGTHLLVGQKRYHIQQVRLLHEMPSKALYQVTLTSHKGGQT